MKRAYEEPRLSDLGSVEELTLVSNKCGTNADFLTPVVPQLNLVGSIVSRVCT